MHQFVPVGLIGIHFVKKAGNISNLFLWPPINLFKLLVCVYSNAIVDFIHRNGHRKIVQHRLNKGVFPLNLFFIAFSFCNIGHNVMGSRPALPYDLLCTQRNPSYFTSRPDYPEFGGVGDRFSGYSLLIPGENQFTILFINKIHQLSSDKFFFGNSEQVAHFGIGKHEYAILCYDNCFVGLFNEHPVFFFTLPECLLNGIFFCYVRKYKNNPDYFSLPIHDGRCTVGNMVFTAIF